MIEKKKKRFLRVFLLFLVFYVTGSVSCETFNGGSGGTPRGSKEVNKILVHCVHRFNSNPSNSICFIDSL